MWCDVSQYRLLSCALTTRRSSGIFTSTSLAAMCEMVTVAISAVGGGSPKPFGYRIPRVTEFSDSSEENVCHSNKKTN